jgi:hypothetical protein
MPENLLAKGLQKTLIERAVQERALGMRVNAFVGFGLDEDSCSDIAEMG